MLADAADTALSAHGEDGRTTRLDKAALKARVMRLAGWMQQAGIEVRDLSPPTSRTFPKR